MPREKEMKLYGMPRSPKGKAYMVIKTSKANTFLVQPLHRMRKKPTKKK